MFFSKYPMFQKEKNSVKKIPLFLNIRTTRFDQSSPVQPNPEEKKQEKCQKITFFTFFLKLFFHRKKESMLSSQFSNIRRTRLDQSSPSSPFQIPLSVTKDERTNEQTENLVSSTHYNYLNIYLYFSLSTFPFLTWTGDYPAKDETLCPQQPESAKIY